LIIKTILTQKNHDSLNVDSFHADIIKFDNKQKALKTEMQNQNRPISSYHRIASAISEKEDKLANDVDISILINDFNEFVKKKGISKIDFCDNLNLYLEIGDFFDLFKKIKYDIGKSQVKALFFKKKTPTRMTVIFLLNPFLIIITLIGVKIQL